MTMRNEAETLATMLGEGPDKIKQIDPQWARYSQEGAVVRVHVGRWRAEIQLTPEDLGLALKTEAERRAFARTIRLGTKYLLPVEWIQKQGKLDSRARYRVEKFSFPTFWGRWVPLQAYADWRAAQEEVESEYLALADEILTRWDELQEITANDYAVTGFQVYNRLCEARFIVRGTDEERDQWIRAFVARTIARIPDPQTVRKQAYITYDVTLIPRQTAIVEDLVKAREMQETAEIERQGRARQVALERLEADLQATAARKAAADMQDFSNDVQTALRTRVFDDVMLALKGIQGNDGRLPRNNSAQLSNLIEWVSTVKFWSDPALEARLQELRRQLDVPSKKRSPEALNSLLRDLGRESESILFDLQRESRRAEKDTSLLESGDLPEVAPARGDLSREAIADVADELGDLVSPDGRRGRTPRDLDLAAL